MAKLKRKHGEYIVWKPTKPTTIDKNLMPRVARVVKRLDSGLVTIRIGVGKSRVIDGAEILRPATPRERELGFVPGI